MLWDQQQVSFTYTAANSIVAKGLSKQWHLPNGSADNLA
jgi:hypothetical protein